MERDNFRKVKQLKGFQKTDDKNSKEEKILHGRMQERSK